MRVQIRMNPSGTPITDCSYHGYLVVPANRDKTIRRSAFGGEEMENANLVISTLPGGTSTVARCSVCDQTFPLSAQGSVDPLVGQRELKSAFDIHVKERHNWRADANRTAALRLRKAMEEFEG